MTRRCIVQLAQMASTVFENVRLYDELRGKDRRKDEFLAMLAHELRNPLSAVDHAVKVTNLTRSNEHIDWCLDVVGRQAKHLGRLIDDLLDVSRITRGKIRLRKVLVDPIRVVTLGASTRCDRWSKSESMISLSHCSLHLRSRPIRRDSNKSLSTCSRTPRNIPRPRVTSGSRRG